MRVCVCATSQSTNWTSTTEAIYRDRLSKNNREAAQTINSCCGSFSLRFCHIDATRRVSTVSLFRHINRQPKHIKLKCLCVWACVHMCEWWTYGDINDHNDWHIASEITINGTLLNDEVLWLDITRSPIVQLCRYVIWKLCNFGCDFP